jgi:hypothetical protein
VAINGELAECRPYSSVPTARVNCRVAKAGTGIAQRPAVPPGSRLAGKGRCKPGAVLAGRRRALGCAELLVLPGTSLAQRPAGSRRGASIGRGRSGARAEAGECLRLTKDFQLAKRAPCSKIPQIRACHRRPRWVSHTEYGFARGEPVPVEPALGNRSASRMAKLGFPRASGGQDARSERPARRHGLAPSQRDVNPRAVKLKT